MASRIVFEGIVPVCSETPPSNSRWRLDDANAPVLLRGGNRRLLAGRPATDDQQIVMHVPMLTGRERKTRSRANMQT